MLFDQKTRLARKAEGDEKGAAGAVRSDKPTQR